MFCMIARYLFFESMDLLTTITIGGFNPSAAAVGFGFMALFALIGIFAGPNFSKLDPDQ